MRRFSIRSLMAFVLVSAVGLAALRTAGDLSAGMVLLVTLAAIGTAMMGAVILRDRERYWWAGFAFFGGGYLALALGPWLSDTFHPQLGTTHLLNEIYRRMHPSIVQKITKPPTFPGSSTPALALSTSTAPLPAARAAQRYRPEGRFPQRSAAHKAAQ